MKYFTLLLVTGILVLSACSDSSDTSSADNQENTNPEEKGLAVTTTDEKMVAIDEKQDKMPQIKSLLYTNEEHDMVDVTAYLNENNKIVKLIDYFQDGKSGIIKQSIFYFNEGHLYASKEIQEIRPKDKTPYYSEVVTFYNKKGKAESTKERKADFEENLEAELFHPIEIVTMSPDHAYKVINQQGEYGITFQGFVNSGPYDFLIVGENKAKGYTSSISIQEPSQTILYLKSKGKEALGKPLVVSFERYVDDQGYEMQILTDVSIVENKK